MELLAVFSVIENKFQLLNLQDLITVQLTLVSAKTQKLGVKPHPIEISRWFPVIFLWYQAESVCSTNISGVDAGGMGEGHNISAWLTEDHHSSKRHLFSEQDQKPLPSSFPGQKKERVQGTWVQ